MYGTGNPGKLHSMRQALRGMDIEIIGLCDLPFALPDAPETGNAPIPLDSLACVLETGEYYYDVVDLFQDHDRQDLGFQAFFERALA